MTVRFSEEWYQSYLVRYEGKVSKPSWAMTEKKFQSEVLKFATMFGWTFYHTWNSFHSAAGFPDLVMVRTERLIFAELKTETGKLTAEQNRWLTMLSHTKVESYLWRPSQIEEIVRILK